MGSEDVRHLARMNTPNSQERCSLGVQETRVVRGFVTISITTYYLIPQCPTSAHTSEQTYYRVSGFVFLSFFKSSGCDFAPAALTPPAPAGRPVARSWRAGAPAGCQRFKEQQSIQPH